MKKKFFSLAFFCVLLFSSYVTKAQNLLTRWNFDDTSISYPSPSPGDGTGTISYLGAVTKSAGNWSTGKHGKRLSTAGYPKLPTDSSGITGTVFATSTAGKAGIHVCYYYRESSTASQTHQMKYSTDGGATWTPFTFSASNPTITNVTTGGNFWADVTKSILYDTGAQSSTVWALISFDLSGITAVNNNANFRFLLTPVFQPDSAKYLPSSGAKKYGSNGSFGFDSVTVSYATLSGCTPTASTTTVSVPNTSLPYTWNGTSYNASGNYIVHLTNAGGCDSAATLVLTVTSTGGPVISGTSSTSTTKCNVSNGTISLQGLKANTAYSVVDSIGTSMQTNTITSDANGVVLMTNLAAGTYSSISVTLGGISSNIIAQVIVGSPPPPPTPVITPSGLTTFPAGGSVSLTSSNANNYLWNTTATSQSIVVSQAGSYTVTITDSNNCTAKSASIVVTLLTGNPFIARWNFDDTTVSFPNPSPGDGVGSISFLGAVTKATGLWSGGKHGKRLSTTNYPKLTTDSSGLTGTVFAASTAGKSGIGICYYFKVSNTASRYHQVKYSTDGGSTWNLFLLDSMNSSISNVTTGGSFALDPVNNVIADTGSQSSTLFGLIKLNLTGLAGVDNNPNFRFLVTPVFAPGTSAYQAPQAVKVYASGGTFGFDSVTISYTSSASGCNPVTKNTTINGCLSVLYNGITYTSSTVKTDTLKSTQGCDSIYNVVTINVKNTGISGNVLYAGKGYQIPGIKTVLSGSYNDSVTASGNFSFNCLTDSGNYKIKVSKNNDVNKTNGVTAVDIALTQGHVLGKNIFNSPYKLIAADVNGDGKVTALDIVYIKRLILGIDSTFNNTLTSQKRLWTFVDSSYKFPDTTNPFPLKDSISFAGLNALKTNQTFIGCKLGDVNWDWNPAVARPQMHNADAVEFSYSTITTGVSNEIKIPVKIRNFKDMLGMQFTLNFNADLMQWKGIGNNPLGIETGTNHAADGNISFLWVDPKNEIKTLEDGSVIMELVFKSTGKEAIENILSLDGSVTEIAAYDKDYNVHNIVMKPGTVSVPVVTKESWNISPNPATNGVIRVQMNLKDNKSVVLRLLDNTGRVLLAKQVEGVKGGNNFTLNKGNIQSGTYYLQAVGVDEVKQLLIKN